MRLWLWRWNWKHGDVRRLSAVPAWQLNLMLEPTWQWKEKAFSKTCSLTFTGVPSSYTHNTACTPHTHTTTQPHTLNGPGQKTLASLLETIHLSSFWFITSLLYFIFILLYHFRCKRTTINSLPLGHWRKGEINYLATRSTNWKHCVLLAYRHPFSLRSFSV